MKLALAGNQNCGKTTLFNQLTGSNQHVGNFPGVTVDRKDGIIRGHEDVTVVDLPGIYSLSPYTAEEIVTRDYLLKEKPDGIINIVDATNIERNLYLSMQLMELGIPMVLALNMMDEVRQNGGSVNVSKLSQELGIPVVPITASKNEGVSELIDVVLRTAQQRQKPKRLDFCQGAVHRAIHSVSHMIEDHAAAIGVPARFAATKLLEGDEPMMAQLSLSPNERELIQHSVEEMEEECGMDCNAALADMRYTFLDDLCAATVVRPHESKEHQRSVRIDRFLTHKFLAIPIFLGIMLLIFWLTFGLVGTFLSDLLSLGIDWVTNLADQGLTAYGINPVVHSLIIDGVFAGIGSVLSFLPIIVTLFFFLSLLEDSGYMARVAFVMDKLLRKIGLSGRSFVPMLIGFGCTVPAVMATRTLSSDRDRKMTILLTPFISCSAKLPIYGVFTAAFFPEYGALVMIGLYVLGILLGILSGLILGRTAFKGNPVPFVMELPAYRLPAPKSVMRLVWDKAKDFITRAFTVIFLATIIIWVLQTFDSRINVVSDSSQSLLAQIGRLIAPLFAPLGFGSWQMSTALLTGFTAKEAVVSTLAVLTGSSMATLPQTLSGALPLPAALAFLVFTLLYTPCVAAIAAVKREMGGARSALFVVFYQTAVAWVAAFLFYRLALLIW
ncbi:ferrous iron transport protein B [Intestinimonas butyriciproducens]|uniref:ferrous iron transport protein B n=1 Tax=Intestinimonas butyriciproducens TaxID=1297617 RepID=UPI00195A374C|nr:ferrous iron transport protein B [Intestinimonas butyriciproducens]MBM6918500.1 ferrous iron transport protein B [Intestinimonas butyriciproducens]